MAAAPRRPSRLFPALAVLAVLSALSAACSSDNGTVTFSVFDADCDGVEGPCIGPCPDPTAPPIDTVMNDVDGDLRGDLCDNCPLVVNPDQADTDFDALGNACDTDDDEDGVLDGADPCPLLNTSSTPTTDGDADGIPDLCDNCPALADTTNTIAVDCNADGDVRDFGEAPGQQCDIDRDLVGDSCDTDKDGDGVLNATDNCPLVSNSLQVDTDLDGIGDACEGG